MNRCLSHVSQACPTASWDNVSDCVKRVYVSETGLVPRLLEKNIALCHSRRMSMSYRCNNVAQINAKCKRFCREISVYTRMATSHGVYAVLGTESMGSRVFLAWTERALKRPESVWASVPRAEARG